MRRTLPAALVLAGLALAGCSGDADGGATLSPGSNAPTATASPTPAATTASPTAEPTTGTEKSPIRWLGAAPTGPAAAVGAATRGYWSTVVRLAERPDPDDPALPEVAADPQLSTLVTLFTTVRADGLSQRGAVDGTVTVAGVSGSTATARTCLDQTLTRVFDKAGTPRPGSAGTLTLFTVTLTRTGGVWKVTGVKGRDNACRTR